MVETLAEVTQLAVILGNRRVGTLATVPDGRVAFEYDAAWLATGFSISPLSLPLRTGTFLPASDSPFDGIFGVFNDSLPDGWGALLLDRMLRRRGIDPGTVNPLTRLAMVGSSGKGALRYEPELAMDEGAPTESLDELARACQRILDDEGQAGDLDELYACGGSSGGARPKAYVSAGGTHWLVKFPCSSDPRDSGEREYRYSVVARACGIDMPRTRLFASEMCSGFFGAERFDRKSDGSGIHMVSASGLLEVTHRLPLLDYRHLFQLTVALGCGEEQLWQLFRLMCFNVFAHNQDDHSNNFSWLCEDGAWRLAPAYDLTYSTSFGDEHATTVNGNGKPEMGDVIALADEVGLKRSEARKVEREIKEKVSTELLPFVVRETR